MNTEKDLKFSLKARRRVGLGGQRTFLVGNIDGEALQTLHRRALGICSADEADVEARVLARCLEWWENEDNYEVKFGASLREYAIFKKS